MFQIQTLKYVIFFQKNYSVIYIKEEENTTLANGNQPAEEIQIFECTE